MKYEISKIKYTYQILNILFFICIFTIYFLIFNIDIAKANDLYLAVYPPLITIEMNPPAEVKTPITIQNLADQTAHLQVVFKPFTASDTEDGHIQYYPENKVPKWKNPTILENMQLLSGSQDIGQLSLAPGQKKNLQLSVSLPKDEPASDYYFSVVFISNIAQQTQGRTNVAEDSNLSRVPGGIATNVLLSIGPKGESQALIEEFSAPFFIQKGPVPFTVRIKNTGSHVIVPEGTIWIKNMYGQSIGKVDLLPMNILAGTVRAIPDTESASKKLRPRANLSDNELKTHAIWNESFLFGLYTATLNSSLSEQGPEYERTIRFFAFPVQAFVGIITAVLLILVVRSKVKKRLK